MTTDRPRLWRDIDVADTATGGLRDAVTTSKNWQERQMFNDYAESGTDIIEPAKQERRALRWLIGAIVLAIVCFGTAWWAGPVRAAERNQSWDVFAFRDGKLLQADARNIVPVESSGPFATRRECIDVGIQTVRIRDAGWRLSCRRVDP